MSFTKIIEEMKKLRGNIRNLNGHKKNQLLKERQSRNSSVKVGDLIQSTNNVSCPGNLSTWCGMVFIVVELRGDDLVEVRLLNQDVDHFTVYAQSYEYEIVGHYYEDSKS